MERYLKDWSQFCDKFNIENVAQVLNSPLWYNSNFNGGNIFNTQNWSNKGILRIADLIDEDGTFLQFNDFKEKFGIRGTFFGLSALISKKKKKKKKKIFGKNG